MKCPNCGKEIAQNSNFCEFCGKEVKSETNSHKYSNLGIKSFELGNNTKRVLCYIIFFLCIVTIVLCLRKLPYNHQEITTKKSLYDSLYLKSDSLNNESVQLEDSILTIKKKIDASSSLIGNKDSIEFAENEIRLSECISESKKFVNNLSEKMQRDHQETLIAYKEVKKRHPNSRKNVYIDLGLPSKTMWSDQNENGLYTQLEAIQKFGKNNLPSIYELQELKEKCKWIVEGQHYKVVGPNGNYIILLANGQGDECDYKYRVGNYGTYWSSTLENESREYYHSTGLGFYLDDKNPFLWHYQPEKTLSVRLVKRKYHAL